MNIVNIKDTSGKLFYIGGVVRDEILDVLHSLDNFTSAIRAKRKSPADVLALARALQKEIDDVVEQYSREW